MWKFADSGRVMKPHCLMCFSVPFTKQLPTTTARSKLTPGLPPTMTKRRGPSINKKTGLFVAVLNGEIVGYADVQPNGYIDHFFVCGNHPRQGIGTQLLARIHQEADALGLTELTANVSKTAEPFFALHGFQVLERGRPVRRGVTLQNARMRKTLTRGDLVT